MKHIAATVLATLALLAGGLASPAQADEPTPPPPCEETVQEWRARALAAESLTYSLMTALADEQARTARLLAGLNAESAALRENLAVAEREFRKVSAKAERRRVKIELLRERIRELSR